MQKQASVSTLNVKVHNNIIRKKNRPNMASLKGLPVESVFSPRKKKTWQNGKVVSDQTTRLLEICPRLIGLKWRCPVSFSTVSVRSTPCLSHPCSKCQESKGKNDQGFITRSHTEGGWYHVTPQRKECLRSKSWCRGTGKKWHLITKNVITHYRKLK